MKSANAAACRNWSAVCRVPAATSAVTGEHGAAEAQILRRWPAAARYGRSVRVCFLPAIAYLIPGHGHLSAEAGKILRLPECLQIVAYEG
jgi:hypothetical protein